MMPAISSGSSQSKTLTSGIAVAISRMRWHLATAAPSARRLDSPARPPLRSGHAQHDRPLRPALRSVEPPADLAGAARRAEPPADGAARHL